MRLPFYRPLHHPLHHVLLDEPICHSTPISNVTTSVVDAILVITSKTQEIHPTSLFVNLDEITLSPYYHGLSQKCLSCEVPLRYSFVMGQSSCNRTQVLKDMQKSKLISSETSDEQVSTSHKEDNFTSNLIYIWYLRQKKEKGENKDIKRQTNNRKSINNCSSSITYVSKSPQALHVNL